MKATTMIPEKELFNKLKVEEDRLASVDQEFFASELSSILDDITRPKIAEEIDAYAADEETRDTSDFCNLEQQLFEKLIAQQDQIESYCKEQKIPIPNCSIPPLKISEFRAYEQGVLINVGGDKIGPLIEAQTEILSYLMGVEWSGNKDEVLSFTKRFAVISEIGQVTNLHDRSVKALQYAYSEIKNFVDSKQILHPDLVLCSTLDEHVRKRCINRKDNGSHEQLYYFSTIMIILQTLRMYDLNTSHHREFVEQFVIVNEKGHIGVSKIAPLITSYDNEKKRLDRTKLNTLRYPWAQLKWFQEVFKNYESMRQNALDNKDYLRERDICHEFKKIKLIATILPNKYRDELIICVRKVILSLDAIQLTAHQSEKKHITYDQDAGILYIHDKKILIAGEGAQGGFTGLFFPNGNTLKEKIHIDEIHQDVFGSDVYGSKGLTKEQKAQVYALRRDINQKIKDGAGISSFFILVLKQGLFAINPEILNS